MIALCVRAVSIRLFFEAEKEFTETGEYVDADVALAELEKKYF